jgi:hypothetical protein
LIEGRYGILFRGILSGLYTDTQDVSMFTKTPFLSVLE